MLLGTNRGSRGGGTGRRAAFRAQWALARAGSTPALGTFLLRGGAEVARQAHNLEVVGSNPTPATWSQPKTARST